MSRLPTTDRRSHRCEEQGSVTHCVGVLTQLGPVESPVGHLFENLLVGDVGSGGTVYG